MLYFTQEVRETHALVPVHDIFWDVLFPQLIHELISDPHVYLFKSRATSGLVCHTVGGSGSGSSKERDDDRWIRDNE